jgi:cell wall-associated NlpC family hydrolase
MSDLIVKAAIAPLNAEPRAGSEQVSQRLAGHRLTVLEDREPWVRVRGEDAYEGWVHRGYLGPADGHRAARTSLGCVIREADGADRPLPLGARVPDDAVIVSGEALEAAALAERYPRDANAIVRSAQRLFSGTPYQWGGITPWGADCSGFVQSIFALHGISLPRDSSQQGNAGATLDRAADALDPADLLFFSDRPDRRVTHVAISLGKSRLVHVAIGRGGYSCENLATTSDAYVTALRERYIFARRIIGV